MHLSIIANDSLSILGFVKELLNQLSPTLALLLIVLAAGIYYFMKQLKKKDIQLADREIQIKELNNTALDRSTTNLKIIHEIETSIDKNDEKYRRIEDLLRDNNSFLKSIVRSLNI